MKKTDLKYIGLGVQKTTGKVVRWRRHVAMSERLAFQKHEKKLVMLLLLEDVKSELEKMKKGDWCEVEAKWRIIKK